MPLRPLADQVDAALRAAQAVHALAVDHRARVGLRIDDLARLTNALQKQFEAIKPLLAFEPAEIQSAAVALYGSQAPADVLALVAAGQAAGAAVVSAIAAAPVSPALAAAYAWNGDGSRLLPRAAAGADIAFLAAPLDALIEALDPVNG